MKRLPIKVKDAEILLYVTQDGAIKVNVIYEDESFWLSQKKMAEIFGVQRPAITKHLKNIFESKELNEQSVCSILEQTAADGKNYLIQKELDELNHIVVMYLDYAELQAKKQQLMKMSDWVKKLDAFLAFNDYDILDNTGKVSALLHLPWSPTY